MVTFFEKLAPTVIAIEASGASHHWARLLQSFGHSVKLIAPKLIKRGKNDAADAEALCEASSRPTMRFVPVKTAEQQAALMLVGVRDRPIRNRTQLANAIRSYAADSTSILCSASRCSSAPKPMSACPPWLGSCSRSRPRNMCNCRRKSTKSMPGSCPGIGPMNVADGSPRSPWHRPDRRCAAEKLSLRKPSWPAFMCERTNRPDIWTQAI